MVYSSYDCQRPSDPLHNQLGKSARRTIFNLYALESKMDPWFDDMVQDRNGRFECPLTVAWKLMVHPADEPGPVVILKPSLLAKSVAHYGMSMSCYYYHV